MPKVTWSSASDWDNAQSQEGVVHESVTNTDHNDDTVFLKGYSASSPVPSSNLVLYCPLQEDSGTTAYDFSGNNYDGTYSNITLEDDGPLFTSSPVGDGSTSQVNFGTTISITPTRVFTVSAWVRLFSVPFTQNRGIAASHGDNGGTIDFRLDSSDIELGGGLNVGPHLNYNYTSWSSNTWHLITFVANGDDRFLYVDGSQVTSATNTDFNPIDPATDFTLFYRGDGNNDNYWWGNIWDFRLYNTNLSSTQIQTYYDVVKTQGTLTTAKKTK